MRNTPLPTLRCTAGSAALARRFGDKMNDLLTESFTDDVVTIMRFTWMKSNI